MEISQQRLRQENRMLRQKVSMLETESGELAERLVRGQVSRADQEETAFHLRRDLEAVKQHDAETTAQLGELRQRLRHMEQVERVTDTFILHSFICIAFILGPDNDTKMATILLIYDYYVQFISFFLPRN